MKYAYWIAWSGEWWNENPIDVVNRAARTGGAPEISDAYTINGQPGALYNCSRKGEAVFCESRSYVLCEKNLPVWQGFF